MEILLRDLNLSILRYNLLYDVYLLLLFFFFIVVFLKRELKELEKNIFLYELNLMYYCNFMELLFVYEYFDLLFEIKK